MEDSRSSRGSLQRLELVDDECSTDSGCSSGGSTGSAELPSRRGTERPRARSGGGSPGSPQEMRVRHRSVPRVRSQLLHGGQTGEPERKRSSSTARRLRKAFQSLKISARLETTSEPPGKKLPAQQQNQQNQQNQQQKRILRSPVTYTYVKGLSGLPTQRIPRSAV